METASHELLRFYSSLKYALARFSEESVESVFLELQEVKTSNQMTAILRDGSLRSSDFGFEDIRFLEDRGLIRETDLPFKFVITLRGVWLVERERKLIDEERLVDFFDAKVGRLFKGRPLSSKEKVILLAMVAARAFSPASSIDLLSDNLTKDHWREVLIQSSGHLVKLGSISALESSRLFRLGGNEHPVSNLIRHTDALSKKTQGMYVAPGKQKYYLSAVAGDEPDTARIQTILRKTLPEKLSIGQGEELIGFMRRVAYTDASLLFDPTVHRFANPQYDDVIRLAVMNLVVESGQGGGTEAGSD